MSKRLASFILAYGVLAGLMAPAGLVAQEQPAPDPAVQQEQQQPPTTTEAPPIETQAAPQPPAPAPQAAATTLAPPPPQPAPKAADPAPVAVASGPGTVTMKELAFSPASVTVNVGDTVTWRNADEVTHDVTANDGSFALGSISRGASGSHTFAKAGTFGYICTIHPGMDGSVKVVAAASGGGGQGGSSGTGGGSSNSSGSGSSSAGSSTTSGSSASLPATGVDAGGMALWGAGFLLIGLFARRRTT